MSAQFVRRNVDLNLHPTPLEVLNPENLVLDVLDSLLEHGHGPMEDQPMDQTPDLPRLDQTWIRDLESEI